MASPGLAPDTESEAALRLIASACRADLLTHREIVLASGDADGIHQTRVALRRLRAAFSMFRPVLEDEAGQREVRELATEAKWLAAACGPARDLEVFLTETVKKVPPAIEKVGKRLALSHLERACAALSGTRFAAFDRQLAAFIDQQPSAAGHRIDDFGRAVLDQRHHEVMHRGRKLDTLGRARLHRLRIAIKKLRYAADFLQPAFAAQGFASEAAKAYIEATTRLQSALGALNDRAVAGQMIADIAVAAQPTEDVDGPLRKLAKQAESGDKRRRRRLTRAWKDFGKVERFWRATQ